MPTPNDSTDLKEVPDNERVIQLASGRTFGPPPGGGSITARLFHLFRTAPKTPLEWQEVASGPVRYIWVRGYSAVVLERTGRFSWSVSVESPDLSQYDEIGRRELESDVPWNEAVAAVQNVFTTGAEINAE